MMEMLANMLTPPGMCLALALCAATAGSEGKDPAIYLVLSISAPSATVRVGEIFQIQATITNTSPVPVTLVLPGDGSFGHRRTPLTTWHISRVDSDEDELKLSSVGCGNINALRPEEVFDLQPGTRKTLGNWLGIGTLDLPGKYVVSLEYENQPSLVWKGLLLEPHDPGAWARLLKSTPCRLVSNELTVQVVPR